MKPAIIAAMLLVPSIAFAQTAAPAATTVDLSGFLNIILQALGALILAVGGTIGTAIAMKLKAKYGIELSAAQQAEMESVATKAVTYGITQATDAIAAKGWNHPDVHSAITAAAAQYAIAQFPEVTARAGFDISTWGARAVTAQKLDDTIMTRVLPAAMTVAAASPATPPATPAKAAP